MYNNIPGWTIKADEFSPGVFRVTLTDQEGRKAEVVDNASEATINLAKNYAFDIERQLKDDWNKFLYDFSLLNLSDRKPIINNYTESAFGSWIIEFVDRRLFYDGRDFLLIFQTKVNSIWTNSTTLGMAEIKYTNLIDIIERLKV